MERYFPKVAKTSSLTKLKSQDGKRRYQPYNQQSSHERAKIRENEPGPELTVKEINQKLLTTLCNVSNPITHSDAGDRADRVVSISTGHQLSEERYNRRLHLEYRDRKLKTQQSRDDSNTSGIFRSVRVYISGYLEGTTEIEMKGVIIEAGGEIVSSLSQCTHIVTSQWLNGSKTHRLLIGKSRNKPYIVRPDWVFQSLEAGKRQAESRFAISLYNDRNLIE